MNKLIAGSSVVTTYQLTRYSEIHNIYDYEILGCYIEYALEYEIQVDIAYAMALFYTNFFTKTIRNNNICGIGDTGNGEGLEYFSSVKRCIEAQYQILKKATTIGYEPEEPISQMVQEIEAGAYKSSDSIFQLFRYTELTGRRISEWHLMLLEINRTRREPANWNTGSKIYYYVRVKSSLNKTEIRGLKNELINKGFEPDNLFIIPKDGMYTLEIGRCQSPLLCLVILQNLAMYNYAGETLYRPKDGEDVVV